MKKTNIKNEIKHEKMEKIFKKLQLNSLDDWLSLPRNKLRAHYVFPSNSPSSLFHEKLIELYPNYPWDFNIIKKFKELKQQRQKMQKIAKKLSIKSLDDWLLIRPSKFITKGGKDILNYYSNDMQNLLKTLYPNYNFSFDKISLHNFYVNKFFQSQKNQLNFLENLFYEFKLTTLEDWTKISGNKIRKNGGKSLLSFYYNNNIKEMFLILYPNYPWDFAKFSPQFSSISFQLNFFNQLFYKLKLNSLDQWIDITKKKIIQNGGYKILSIYSNDLQKLLTTIYPNFPWNFDQSFLLLDNQRKFFDYLFKKFNLKDKNDWSKISRYRISNFKDGRRLLALYSFNLKNLLTTLYPDHFWDFSKLKYKPTNQFHSSFEYHLEKLKFLIKKYKIKEKKDWFRLTIKQDDIKLIETLKIVYPNEEWKKENFLNRSKKTNQRLLFITIQSIYSMYLIIENYKNNSPYGLNYLEFDLYIPALNMAMEYQGEQHFDDIPSVFSQNELYKSYDQIKLNFAIEKKVNLIVVPFWWDHSSASLSSFLNSPPHFSSPSSSYSSLLT